MAEELVAAARKLWPPDAGAEAALKLELVTQMLIGGAYIDPQVNISG